MPVKLNLGLSRQAGEAGYGSRGASVSIEVEVEGSLIAETEKLKDRIRELFGVVRATLEEELNGGRGGGRDPPAPGADVALPARTATGVTGALRGGMRCATPAQVKALYALTRQQGLDLREVVRDRCHVARLEDLTLRQASSLIDQLKSPGDRPGP